MITIKIVNMHGVRVCLGMKSVRWKTANRVLERIHHAVRMENDRLKKVVILSTAEREG